MSKAFGKGMYSGDNCIAMVNQYPRHQYMCRIDNVQKHVFFSYRYGTSGFRGNHTTLNSVMVRVGLLATLRSMALGGQAVGIMITASHNPEQDNGVKIIDPSGEMLDGSWESTATDIANLPENEVVDYLNKLYEAEVTTKFAESQRRGPTVFVGYDTRPHSRGLTEILITSMKSINLPENDIKILNFNEVTTPQLHYLVRRVNMKDGIPLSKINKDIYLNEILSSFQELMKLLKKIRATAYGHDKDAASNSKHQATNNNTNEEKMNEIKNELLTDSMLGDLIVDCANGVGGLAFEPLADTLSQRLILNLNLIHLPNKNFKVNEQCGAEWIHKDRQLPKGLQFAQKSNYNYENNLSFLTKKDDATSSNVVTNNNNSNNSGSASGGGNNDDNSKKLDLLSAALVNKRMCSVDGDCDRLMYYTIDSNYKLCVIDGDKQICILFQFMKPFIDIIVKEANGINTNNSNIKTTESGKTVAKATNTDENKEEEKKKEENRFDLSVGVVQTAYANGASGIYMSNTLGIKSIIAKTGVKHLHHEAKNCDIGIYFEANGHGTVLISDECVEKLQALLMKDATTSANNDVSNNNNANNNKLSKECKQAIQILLLIHDISNQAIGDALADCLLCEAALYYLNWNINNWYSIYSDLPNSLTKIEVKDRTIFELTNAEQTCVKPEKLQNEINKYVKQYKYGRSFVRPSGTEDCVRVYSEADTAENADELNIKVRQAVYDLAGGVGDRPKLMNNVD